MFFVAEFHSPANPQIYKEAYERSLKEPEIFWSEIANDITWMKPWNKVVDNSNPPFTKW